MEGIDRREECFDGGNSISPPLHCINDMVVPCIKFTNNRRNKIHTIVDEYIAVPGTRVGPRDVFFTIFTFRGGVQIRKKNISSRHNINMSNCPITEENDETITKTQQSLPRDEITIPKIPPMMENEGKQTFSSSQSTVVTGGSKTG